jgi:hypothetical protein
MCRFWAGGISSFPFSRAREYRLLRRLLFCGGASLLWRGEEMWRTKQGRKNGGHFLSNLPLLEGNMLYLISILVVEYLDCQYRWKFRTPSPNLMRYFDIKFLLCTWFANFALWAIFELY